jgi:two-component system chemotaxis response regulator CheY
MRSLAIDDEFISLSKMVAMLEPFGSCDAATSSQQALDLFRQALDAATPYRLVTIDIHLPGMSGITLLGRLQAEERRRGVARSRKLMVTAEATAGNVLAALTGECDGFMVKPVRQAALLEKLAALGLLTENVAHFAANTLAQPQAPPGPA